MKLHILVPPYNGTSQFKENKGVPPLRETT